MNVTVTHSALTEKEREKFIKDVTRKMLEIVKAYNAKSETREKGRAK